MVREKVVASYVRVATMGQLSSGCEKQSIACVFESSEIMLIYEYFLYQLDSISPMVTLTRETPSSSLEVELPGAPIGFQTVAARWLKCCAYLCSVHLQQKPFKRPL